MVWCPMRHVCTPERDGMEFVTRSSVKSYLKHRKKRMASNACDAMDMAIEEMLRKACARAESNERSTVMPQDL